MRVRRRNIDEVGDHGPGGRPEPYDSWWRLPIKPDDNEEIGYRMLRGVAVWFVVLVLIVVLLTALAA